MGRTQCNPMALQAVELLPSHSGGFSRTWMAVRYALHSDAFYEKGRGGKKKNTRSLPQAPHNMASRRPQSRQSPSRCCAGWGRDTALGSIRSCQECWGPAPCMCSAHLVQLPPLHPWPPSKGPSPGAGPLGPASAHPARLCSPGGLVWAVGLGAGTWVLDRGTGRARSTSALSLRPPKETVTWTSLEKMFSL